MFLKVSQSNHLAVFLASLRPSRMEAKGVAVLQRGIGDDASEGSSSAAVEKYLTRVERWIRRVSAGRDDEQERYRQRGPGGKGKNSECRRRYS
jgi:hypothetical protein